MDNSTVTPDGLADPDALHKIDDLFACGVGDHIDLPQLVVVGDQSSGKSSVLQAFMNLPFPRDSGLCTRFATQVMFRRAAEARVSVSIKPASKASSEHVDRVKNWAKTDIHVLDTETFAAIMKEVHELMDLRDKGEDGTKPTFSEDVLRLEVSGPDQEHFSVVDVPGIFRATTEGQTTKTDRIMVKRMVCEYMENPRSVMLAVVPANVDIATQEILQLAKDYDPEQIRTLGVLTKPDIVDTGAEAPIVDLIKGMGKGHQLSLGWFMVRNPGQKQLEDPLFDRNAGEKEFFQSKAPWSSLEKDKVGVEALRLRLREVLAERIRGEFPKVALEINKELARARQARKTLGSKRETTEEQRQYLFDISMRFQDIAGNALQAHYVSNDWFDEHYYLRFATQVRNRNEKFSLNLQDYGQSYRFDDGELTEAVEVATEVRVERYETDSGASNDSEAALEKDRMNPRYVPDHADLSEITAETSEPLSMVMESGIQDWLADIYRTSRGFELGTFGTSLLPMAFKTQSSKWESLTLGYVADIITLAHRFIDTLLRLLCPDSRSKEGLMYVLMDDLFSKYRAAMERARFLLQSERMGTPATTNHYFSDNLEKSRQDRIERALKKQATWIGHREVVDVRSVRLTHTMSNEENVVLNIHDILQAYYKVARKRFADNVIMQAADFHLVTGPETPLKLFSPAFVNRLSEKQLREIAGEDPALQRKRAALTKEIEALERGKKVLR